MPHLRPLLASVLLIFCSNINAHAVVLLSFGGYTWDQADVPNKGLQLGVDDATTRSGAAFGPASPATNMTRTNNITGFIEATAGANTAVGYLSRITKRRNGDPNPNTPLEDGLPTAIDGSNKTTPAVNIPQAADIGTALIRRGIQVGWNTGTGGFAQPILPNRPGADFVIWESGDLNQPDAMMVRVRNAVTRQFTDWFYFAPEGQPAVTGARLFAFEYDLTDFGLASFAQIDLIEMANMISTDRIAAPGTLTSNGWVAEGRVKPYPAGGPPAPAFDVNNPGPNPSNPPKGINAAYGVPYGGATYDPDPLYVSPLNNLQQFVPEPTSCICWALIGLITFGRRGHRQGS